MMLPMYLIETGIVSHDDRIVNIRVRQQLNRNSLRSMNLSNRLNDPHNDQLRTDLATAYEEYMNKVEYIVTQSITFYNNISYTVLEDDGEPYTNIKLYPKNVVTIQEEGGESYAIVRAIFTHKYNDTKKRAFILLDWLRDTQRFELILRCPIYEKQRPTDRRWHRVYLISMIDNLPRVQFLHYCTGTCQADFHDTTNIQYLKNVFFYKAV